MDKLFKKLASTPGVIGAFIYHREDGIKEKSMPAVFKDENLNRIAASLTKMLAAGKKGFICGGCTTSPGQVPCA